GGVGRDVVVERVVRHGDLLPGRRSGVTVLPAVSRPTDLRSTQRMTELGPMPPTPDVGPVAEDAGSLEPIAPGVWVWLGTDGRGRPGPNVGVIVEDDGITLVDTVAAPSPARAL